MRETPTIPGEPRLSQRIRDAAGRGALGHAAIISGPGDRIAAARFFAAALQCQGDSKPCGTCPDCRKVFRDVHPDVITVLDPEHKNVSVDVLRGVVADASVLPNEGRRKVYIFPDCSILDGKAQNVLLKVVEDGPAHAAFVFCAENSAVLLQTIRSRSVEWKLSPGGEEAGADERARELCELICGGKAADLAAFCAQLENSKISREELRALLSDARDILVAGLAAGYGVGDDPFAAEIGRAMGRDRLSRAIDRLGEYIRQCGYNIGVGHLTGAMAVDLAGREAVRQFARCRGLSSLPGPGRARSRSAERETPQAAPLNLSGREIFRIALIKAFINIQQRRGPKASLLGRSPANSGLNFLIPPSPCSKPASSARTVQWHTSSVKSGRKIPVPAMSEPAVNLSFTTRKVDKEKRNKTWQKSFPSVFAADQRIIISTPGGCRSRREPMWS